jgi:hypothetical protein
MTSSINDINWEKGGTGGIINNKENIDNEILSRIKCIIKADFRH